MSARRKYSDSYKAESVDLVMTSGRSVAEIARDLGVHEGTLGNWVALAKKRGAFADKPLTIDERSELAELRDLPGDFRTVPRLGEAFLWASPRTVETSLL